MIQCSECEFFRRSENGDPQFLCDPFSNVKEPDCLLKWQIIKINQMVSGYQATLQYYEKFAPMQEKVFRMMESEIDALEEADQWKQEYDDGNEEEEGDDFEEGDFEDEFEDPDDEGPFGDPDAWKK